MLEHPLTGVGGRVSQESEFIVRFDLHLDSNIEDARTGVHIVQNPKSDLDFNIQESEMEFVRIVQNPESDLHLDSNIQESELTHSSESRIRFRFQHARTGVHIVQNPKSDLDIQK